LFKEILLPDELAFGSRGGRRYSTDVVVNRGGYEKRNASWQDPLGRWDIGFTNRTLAQTRRLQGFFHEVRARRDSFLFFDHKDSEMVRATAHRIDATTYQLRQRYQTATGETTYINVYHPYLQTMTVALGTRQTPFSGGPEYGQITLPSAVSASVNVNVTGRFYIEVRFDVDHFDVEEVDVGVFSWPSIPLVEVRP
jgi:uncharacterized protein (TIGR02217 family)